MTSGLENSVSLKPSQLLCLLAINWPSLSCKAVVVLRRNAEPRAWTPLTSLKGGVSRIKGEATSRICPRVAVHISQTLSLPGHIHPSPFITAQDIFLTPKKMPLTKFSRSHGESQELWEGGGKQCRTRLPGPPHFCPSTYGTPQKGSMASFKHQPWHQDTFKTTGTSQAFAWHDPFPMAPRGAWWQPWREMGETRPWGFLSLSLKLQLSPSVSFSLELPWHGPEPITYLL